MVDEQEMSKNIRVTCVDVTNDGNTYIFNGGEEVLRLNPYNFRNWDLYRLQAVDRGDHLGFDLVDRKHRDSEAIQQLTDSLLRYENSEEAVNAIAVVDIHNAPKVSTIQTTDDGKFRYLLGGNSRLRLIGEMITAWDEADKDLVEKYGFEFRVLPISVKTDYELADLFTWQVSDNTGIKPSGTQTIKTLLGYRQLLTESDERFAVLHGLSLFEVRGSKSKEIKDAEAELAKAVAGKFNYNPETYRNSLRISEAPQWLLNLIDNGTIGNAIVVLKMLQTIGSKLQKASGVANVDTWLTDLWDEILAVAKRKGDFKITLTHFNEARKSLEKTFNLDEKEDPGDLSGSNEQNNFDDSGETSETDHGETKITRRERIQQLRELGESDRAALNELAEENFLALVESAGNLSSAHFETNDVITLLLLAEETAEKIRKVPNAAQRAIAAAEAEEAKAAKQKPTANVTA